MRNSSGHRWSLNKEDEWDYYEEGGTGDRAAPPDTPTKDSTIAGRDADHIVTGAALITVPIQALNSQLDRIRTRNDQTKDPVLADLLFPVSLAVLAGIIFFVGHWLLRPSPALLRKYGRIV